MDNQLARKWIWNIANWVNSRPQFRSGCVRRICYSFVYSTSDLRRQLASRCLWGLEPLLLSLSWNHTSVSLLQLIHYFTE